MEDYRMHPRDKDARARGNRIGARIMTLFALANGAKWARLGDTKEEDEIKVCEADVGKIDKLTCMLAPHAMDIRGTVNSEDQEDQFNFIANMPASPEEDPDIDALDDILDLADDPGQAQEVWERACKLIDALWWHIDDMCTELIRAANHEKWGAHAGMAREDFEEFLSKYAFEELRERYEGMEEFDEQDVPDY